MFNSLTEISKRYNLRFLEENKSFEREIISIFNGNLDIDFNNSILICCLGFYYYVKNDSENMFKYCLMASDLGNSDAMNRLGRYYEEKKDYENMLKYYLMAIKLGNTTAMNSLGIYYKNKKDYDKMFKYYLMASNLGNSHAMFNLGVYYQIKEDYENMIKYYLMAINLGNYMAMSNLGWHYYDQKDYENMAKYYIMYISLDLENTVYTGARSIAMFKLLQSIECVELFKKMFEFLRKNTVSSYFLEKLKEVSNDTSIQSYIKEKCRPYKQNHILSFLYHTYVIHNIKCQDNYNPDFKIIVKFEDSLTEYYIHCTVLSSKYFEKLMYGNFEKCMQITIEVNYIKTIFIFIKYLYLQEIEENIEEGILQELIELADEYLFEDFKELCELSKYRNI